ncbi:hypothetical protein, partial [Staphylococcus equorum]
NKYAFFIIADYEQFNNDRRNFSNQSKNLLKGMSKDLINSNYKVDSRLNKLESERKDLHKFNKITKRFNLMSSASFFIMPLLSLDINLLMFNEEGFFIYKWVMSITFVFVNALLIYSDFRFKDGNINHTYTMIKKHNLSYRKLQNKYKQTQ